MERNWITRPEQGGAAIFERGLRYHRAGDLQQAEACYRQALTFDPAHADSLHFLGLIAFQIGRYDLAVAQIGTAIKLRPQAAHYHCNLANALFHQARLDEAEAAYREALRLAPNDPIAHNNLGNVLRAAGQLDRAEGSYRTALRLKPDFPDAHNGLGVNLSSLGRYAEAEACYREAVRLAPDYAEAHYNIAGTLLLAGRFDEAWPEFEWRWKVTEDRLSARDFAQPIWQGEDISGKVILLHAEQGLGDTLQFCRYAPLVAARGAGVVLEIQPPLQGLLSTLAGVENLVMQGDPLPQFDLHCPLMSLPRAFGTKLETIPAEVPYLKADPVLVARWSDRVSGFDGLRVGLVWAGNPRRFSAELSAVDRRRSIALEQFAPLAALPGLVLISLQKGEAAAEIDSAPPGLVIHDWTHELDNFADTAALIDTLDLVISVDTSVAHLAGALGRPVWLLNRFDTCWRWLLEREDSPWYPGLRQFRQPRPGDWDSVLEKVGVALKQSIQAHRRTLSVAGGTGT